MCMCLPLKVCILIFVFGRINLSLLDLGIIVSLEIEIIQKRAVCNIISFGCVSAQIRICKIGIVEYIGWMFKEIKESFYFKWTTCTWSINSCKYCLIFYAKRVKIPMGVVSIDDKYFSPFNFLPICCTCTWFSFRHHDWGCGLTLKGCRY